MINKFRKYFSTKASDNLKKICQTTINEIKEMGTFKNEKQITSPQSVEIMVNGRKMLNFCANNYLGLSNNKELIEEAKKALDQRGYGMSSVRFICGTQDIHKQLEATIAGF